MISLTPLVHPQPRHEEDGCRKGGGNRGTFHGQSYRGTLTASALDEVQRGGSTYLERLQIGRTRQPHLVDEALAPTMARSQRDGVGIYLPSLFRAQHDTMPRNRREKTKWAIHLAFVDDMVLLAKDREEVRSIHHDLSDCYKWWGLPLRDDKLCLWGNFPILHLGGRAVTPQATMPFHGCMLSGDRHGRVNTGAQKRSWSVERLLTTRVLGRAARLRRLRSDDVRVVGRVIRWQSAEDVAAMKEKSGRTFGPWSRTELRRPRLR